jgi:hypothetical protein
MEERKKTALHTEEAAEATRQQKDDIVILPDTEGAPGIELAEAVGTPPTPEDLNSNPQLEQALDALFDEEDDTGN